MGYFIYKDQQGFKDQNSNNLYVLTLHNKTLVAFSIQGNNSPVFFNDNNLAAIDAAVQKEVSPIGYNRTFVFRSELLDTTKTYDFAQTKLTYPQMLAMLTNSSDANLKAFIFVSLINDYLQPDMLAVYYQNGAISVYPETITFKVIRYVPESLLSYALSMRQTKAAQVMSQVQ